MAYGKIPWPNMEVGSSTCHFHHLFNHLAPLVFNHLTPLVSIHYTPEIHWYRTDASPLEKTHANLSCPFPYPSSPVKQPPLLPNQAASLPSRTRSAFSNVSPAKPPTAWSSIDLAISATPTLGTPRTRPSAANAPPSTAPRGTM